MLEDAAEIDGGNFWRFRIYIPKECLHSPSMFECQIHSEVVRIFLDALLVIYKTENLVDDR